MSAYSIPTFKPASRVGPTEVLLVANGDLRDSANKVCWPAQAAMEAKLAAAFAAEGMTLRRAHPHNPELQHGFIYNQRMGMNVFAQIHPASGCR
jgi:hypothetical protein